MEILNFKSKSLRLTAGVKSRLRLAVLSTLIFFPTHVYADNTELEYRVKSAFLFNFTKFIQWPAAKKIRSDFSMCVAGNRQFYAKLIDTLGNMQNNNQAIKFNFIQDPSEAQQCQLVFLGFADRESLKEWISGMSGFAVLTVSDAQDFINVGGMIQFIIIDGKIRFDINQSAAHSLSIKVSSKLLGLARNVN